GGANIDGAQSFPGRTRAHCAKERRPMNVEAPIQPTSPVQSGVIVPHEPTFKQRVLAWLIYTVIRLVVATLRFRWDAFPSALSASAGPHIFCVWHNRLPL